MAAIRELISLEKPGKVAFETYEMFEGIPNSFLALLGFLFDGGLEGFGRGNLEHPEFPVLDADSMFTALEDLYDIARTDPQGFEAAFAASVVKDHTIRELKDIADRHNPKTAINTKPVEDALQTKRGQRKTAAPAVQHPESRDQARKNTRENEQPERTEKPQKPDIDIDIDEAHVDRSSYNDPFAGQNKPPKPEDAGWDIDDLILDQQNQKEDEEADYTAADTSPREEPLPYAVAWDRIGEKFNGAASDRIMRENADSYQRNVAKAAWDRANQDPHDKRRDCDLPYEDRQHLKINAELQAKISQGQSADMDLGKMQSANTLPL